MGRTTGGDRFAEIEWRRPRQPRTATHERSFGQERPSFIELLVPLVTLAVGSILALAVTVVALTWIASLVL